MLKAASSLAGVRIPLCLGAAALVAFAGMAVVVGRLTNAAAAVIQTGGAVNTVVNDLAEGGFLPVTWANLAGGLHAH